MNVNEIVPEVFEKIIIFGIVGEEKPDVRIMEIALE